MAGLNQIKALNFHPQIILPVASHNPLPNSNKIQPKTAREENLAPIFVAWEQGLNGSAQASIQTAATKVTNMLYLSFGVRLFISHSKPKPIPPASQLHSPPVSSQNAP